MFDVAARAGGAALDPAHARDPAGRVRLARRRAIPLLLALTSVFATMGLVALPSQIVPMDESISEVILLIGLAVGVDYSLFYIRRERDERRAGRSERAALEAAAATSGRAVLISGVTVMIAMAGMFFSGDKTFMSFAIGTMMVVARRDDRLADRASGDALLARRPRRQGAGAVPLAAPPRRRRGSRLGQRSSTASSAGRSSRPSPRRRCSWRSRLPALSLHTATSGLDALPKSLKEMQSFNKVNDAFPGGATPAVVAIAGDASDPALQAAVAELRAQALASGQALEPIRRRRRAERQGDSGRDPARRDGHRQRVERGARRRSARRSCRRRSARSTASSTRSPADTAASRDWNDAMKSAVPIVFAFVLAFAFLLLLVTFRSIVIPLKAILMNLLSVAAAYGVVVAVFQWGWGENLLDFNSNGGIAAWLPMFLFVILFGLSMDYHVFILSRVREYYDRGLDTEQAVAKGIKSTAGVVTSAAVVMVLVFGVFALMPIIDMKEMGIGLAAAILIDATIVRGGAPARDDEAAGQVELVPAALARVAPQPRARATVDRSPLVSPPS